MKTHYAYIGAVSTSFTMRIRSRKLLISSNVLLEITLYTNKKARPSLTH